MAVLTKPAQLVADTDLTLTKWNAEVGDNINYLIAAGADLASAAAIAPTNEFHPVTGVTTIDTLNVVAPIAGQRIRLWIKNGPLVIRNNGGGGNIRTLSGYDRVVLPNETVTLAYDGAVWREAGLPPGLTKFWDSTEAGVAFPTAQVGTPALPQTHKHLRIRIIGEHNGATGVNGFLRMNTDASPNYYYRSVTNGTPAVAAGATSIFIGLVGWVGALKSCHDITIFDYTNGGSHQCLLQSYIQNDGSAVQTVVSIGGLFNIGGPVSTLQWILASNLWSNASRFTVYGEA